MTEFIEEVDQVTHPAHWLLNNGIRRFRISKGMSQYDLEAETKIPQRTISAYELGEVSPDLKHLRLIAETLGCTVPDLTENNSKAYAHRRSRRKTLAPTRYRGRA